MSAPRPLLQEKHKFLTLDALRGLAALAVVQWHASDFFPPRYFRHGYLAVDFFFLLSGFVLHFAYQRRLDSGWPTGSFLKARLIRLYPLYLLGLLLGVATLVIPFFRTDAPVSHSTLGAYIVLGLLVIPIFPFLHIPTLCAFPLNFPTWSLFGETIANLFHVLALRRRSTRFLLCAIAISAVLLIAVTMHLGSTNFGVFPRGALFSPVRVAFPYLLGIFLSAKCMPKLRWKRIPPIIPCALLLIVLALPASGHLAKLYDLAAIFIAFPLVLLLGAHAPPTGHVIPVFQWLGRASYPIYVIHAPLLGMYLATLRHFRFSLQPLPATLIFITVTFLLATLASILYDVPVHRRLSAPARQG